ncbi:MAG: tRNA (guanine(46)-N(7))-methyltransferase TrmB [Amphiplicatus sp.]
MTAAKKPASGYIAKVYGRRQDKPLKPRQERLMQDLLPRVAMPDPRAGAVDPGKIFPQSEEIELEIGFGGGEHLAFQAALKPARGFIGAEPFVNSVAKLLVRIEEEKLENVRIHFGDARPLMEALPDASLVRLYVLHPDPWPKKRHFKRRMISPWFFAEAARLVKKGGELRVASDVPDYVRWTLMHAQNAPAFEWTAMRAADWREPPEDWPKTRYEAKGRAHGRPPAYLRFLRK